MAQRLKGRLAPNGEPLYLCPLCGGELARSAFYTTVWQDRRTPGKVIMRERASVFCKPCMVVYAKRWRKANPEKDRERKRRYNARYPERARAYSRASAARKRRARGARQNAPAGSRVCRACRQIRTHDQFASRYSYCLACQDARKRPPRTPEEERAYHTERHRLWYHRTIEARRAYDRRRRADPEIRSRLLDYHRQYDRTRRKKKRDDSKGGPRDEAQP